MPGKANLPGYVTACVSILMMGSAVAGWYATTRVIEQRVDSHLMEPCHSQSCKDVAEIVGKMDILINLVVQSHNASIEGKKLPPPMVDIKK